ncbi:MAG: hypothetical protein LBU98_03480 [Alistipes sp.]|nr:hypothetical protein [Alistipes sp.]
MHKTIHLFNFAAAGPEQAPKRLLCPLRGLRKHQNNFCARCAGCASAETTFLPVARAAQASKQLFCPLRGLRKRRNNFFARCAGCASAAEVVLPAGAGRDRNVLKSAATDQSSANSINPNR